MERAGGLPAKERRRPCSCSSRQKHSTSAHTAHACTDLRNGIALYKAEGLNLVGTRGLVFLLCFALPVVRLPQMLDYLPGFVVLSTSKVGPLFPLSRSSCGGIVHQVFPCLFFVLLVSEIGESASSLWLHFCLLLFASCTRTMFFLCLLVVHSDLTGFHHFE